MYAKIGPLNDLKSRLRYHENKIKAGMAECIAAGNSLKDLDQLTRKDKLYHFQRRNVRNDIAKVNTTDIAITFHPSEKFSNAQMTGIAEQYLKEMGLHNQPYLIYRHYDVPHPHCHVVYTNIQKNGKQLRLKKKNYYYSKQTSRSLEKQHSLIQAGNGKASKGLDQLAPLQKVAYGITPIVPTFSRILDAVIDSYKFTSLEEFNALLAPYNMEAYRGKIGSLSYENKGLFYRTVAENGKKDVIIKASRFGPKFILKNLEYKFLINQLEAQRPEQKQVPGQAITQQPRTQQPTPISQQELTIQQRILQKQHKPHQHRLRH